MVSQVGRAGLWARVPFYARILIGLALGVVAGVALGPAAASLDEFGRLLLRALGAVAPPLVFVAVVRALMTADVGGRDAGRLGFLLATNTLMAIAVGLLVANVLRPGSHADLPAPNAAPRARADVLTQLLDNIPGSLLEPFVHNRVIGVVLLAVAIGIALRRQEPGLRRSAERAVSIGFEVLLTILHWVLALVPIAVFAKVASVVGTQGFAPFKALGVFILAVLTALALQSAFYLLRVRLGSWVRPWQLVRDTRDALIMAFSTASSTATMPVTYENLRDKIGLSDRSASLGALVGSNFNNDGTALYEAMSALFVAQLLGQQLSLGDQLLLVITSVIASVGAAGIPEAGLVTMTLVFTAVRLPIEYIALLLTVDWFLDRCRTAINVMGDMTVSCLLDGRVRPPQGDPRSERTAAPA